MNARFRELDGLRGLAAVAVVVYHFTTSYDSFYPGAPTSPVSIWWGMFGVQLFFMISGYVILMTGWRARRPSDFAISRASRLYPAYWIAATLSLLVTWVANVPHERLAWWQVLANFSMVQRWFLIPNIDDVYWTLAIEMQFYVLVFALLVLFRCELTARRVTLAVAGWLAVATVAAVWAFPQTQGLNPQHYPLPVKLVLNAVLAEWAPLFGTGVLAFLARRERRFWPAALGAGVLAVVLAGLLNGWVYASVVGVMVTLFLVVIALPSTPPLLWRPVQFYGRLSYSLYIAHSIHGTAIMHLLLPALGRVGAMVVAFAGVTLIAWAVHELGEVRGSAWLKRQLVRLRDSRSDLPEPRTTA